LDIDFQDERFVQNKNLYEISDQILRDQCEIRKYLSVKREILCNRT